MKQETIERLRTQYPPHLEDSKFMTFELRTETWADILAVLEAATDHKQADEELEFLANKGDGVPEDVFQRHDATHAALLVLIDLGGTK